MQGIRKPRVLLQEEWVGLILRHWSYRYHKMQSVETWDKTSFEVALLMEEADSSSQPDVEKSATLLIA